jgi:hypothetical protein
MTNHPEVSSLVAALEPHNTLNPPVGFYIQREDGNDDCLDYCEECAEDYCERLNLYTSGELLHAVMVADSCSNHDSLPLCDCCGKTLAGWPTDYCRDQEIAYFMDEPDFPPSPENIHVICMILWNLQWLEDADVVNKVIQIGRSVLEKIAQIPTTEGARP